MLIKPCLSPATRTFSKDTKIKNDSVQLADRMNRITEHELGFTPALDASSLAKTMALFAHQNSMRASFVASPDDLIRWLLIRFRA